MEVKYHPEDDEIEFCFNRYEANAMAFLMQDLLEKRVARGEVVPELEPGFFKEFANTQDDFFLAVTLECLDFATSFLKEVWNYEEWEPNCLELLNVENCLRTLEPINHEGVTLH